MAEDDTTTIVFVVMTVSAVFIIGLSCLIYKCRKDPKNRYIPEQFGVSDTEDESHYRDDTLSEEDQLMIPMDREDTIESLKHQLSQVSLANVRYIQVASVDKEFRIKDGSNPREFFVNDIITFRDIAIGFIDGIPDKKDEKSGLTKRAMIIYAFCDKQLSVKNITNLNEIIATIIYLCKIIIRLRFNKKKSNKYVSMRDEKSEQFKNDLLPIAEWIWNAKMEENQMETKEFAQNMSQWIQEIQEP